MEETVQEQANALHCRDARLVELFLVRVVIHIMTVGMIQITAVVTKAQVIVISNYRSLKGLKLTGAGVTTILGSIFYCVL